MNDNSTPDNQKEEPSKIIDTTIPPATNIKKRNKWIYLFSLLIFALAIAWLILYLLYFQFREYTDDAYANGNLININAAVPGSVVAFYADNTDLVQAGQLLVELDKTAYQVRFDKAIDELAVTVLQVRQLFDNVNVAKFEVENRKISLARTQYDFDNRSKLVDSEAIAKQDFIHSRDDVATAKSLYKESEARLTAAISAAGNTDIENHPLLMQAKSEVRNAYYNLMHCSIYAPTTGYIAQRTVDVGQWATTQTPLMGLIPKDYVWVDANYKETQLTYMRVGQPATVTFDIYGSGVVFKGKVLGIASGTGSVFSLIPPQNATGNWIKIVQRLPVRISLDSKMLEHYPMRLGLSAEVRVDITNQDLPMLVDQTQKKPVATTDVFNLQMNQVNKMIEKIVNDNLIRS